MWTWRSAFQLNYYFPGKEWEWPEKPPVFTSDLQAISALTATPSPLSSSPPTPSTNFHFGKSCGGKAGEAEVRISKAAGACGVQGSPIIPPQR